MKRVATTVLAIILGVIGAVLALLQVDREFIALAPTQGQAHTIPLDASRTYEQEFAVYAESISSISVYLRPLQRNLPPESIAVRVTAGDQSRVATVPAVFLDPDTPAQIPINPPLRIVPGQNVNLEISVPEILSGKVGAQERVVDETFNTHDVTFSISGDPQENPLAYHVFRQVRPIFTLQLAGLLVLAALFLLIHRVSVPKGLQMPVGVAAFVLLYSLPLFVSGTVSIPLLVVQFFVALGAVALFRAYGLSPLSIFIGTALITGTTWWAAHTLASDALFTPLTLKDAFVDPNQTIISHAAGAYVGVPGLLLALIGVLTTGRRFMLVFVTGICGIVLARFVSPHVFIITAASVAWFAAFGMESLRTFLGKNDTMVKILLGALAVIILVDLYTIGATTLESTLLP